MLLALSFALLPMLGSCTRSSNEPSSSSSSESSGGLRLGRPELQFDYKATRSFELSVANPLQGERWTTRIRRGENPLQPGSDAWMIEVAPGGRALGDNLANGTLILHLLDTVRTLQVKDATLSGTPESFGLAPPWYDLRWTVAGSTQEHELALGSPAKAQDGSFAGLYGRILQPATGPQTEVMNGSLLKMLELIPDFNALRLQRFVTFESDDVDEIEIYGGASPDVKANLKLYAQREGDHWTDARHKPLSQDLSSWLDQLSHLRIQRFVDDPAEAARLRRQPLLHAIYTLRFRGRTLRPVVVRLAHAGEAFGTISSRATPESRGQKSPQLSVFELFPQSLGLVPVALRNP